MIVDFILVVWSIITQVVGAIVIGHKAGDWLGRRIWG
jgi:hypothetical protein